MVNSSHWDFAKHFSGNFAAWLILGLEPGTPGNELRVSVVRERMKQDYERALDRALVRASVWNMPGFEDEHTTKPLQEPPEGTLLSVELENQWAWHKISSGGAIENWLFDKQYSLFERQLFSRASILTWLNEIALSSVYRFDPNQTMQSSAEEGIDPSDLPGELQAANIAYRAVVNGYGEKSETFKNRLKDFLQKNFVNFNNDTVYRIATVANPDKGRGRKKSVAE